MSNTHQLVCPLQYEMIPSAAPYPFLSHVASVASPAASIAADALGLAAVKAIEVVEVWGVPFSVVSSALLLPPADVVLDVVVHG